MPIEAVSVDNGAIIDSAVFATIGGQVTVTAPGFAPRSFTSADRSLVTLVPESPRIAVWPLSAAAGERISVIGPIGADAHLFVCRFGATKERLKDLGGHDHRPLANTLLDSDQLAADGLRVGECTGFTIEPGWRSGLYSVEVVDADGTTVQHHPFVVDDPHPDASVPVVIANLLTWNSYNLFGGRSRYLKRPVRPTAPPASLRSRAARFVVQRAPGLTDRVPPRLASKLNQAPDWVMDPLSLRRPLDAPGLHTETPDDRFEDHLAGSEWRLLAWLERQEIPYRLVADMDVAAATPSIANGTPIILSTHSEYWEPDGWQALMRLHRERGCWLLNLSGNSLYSEVTLNTERDASRHVHHTLARTEGRDRDPIAAIGVQTPVAPMGDCSGFFRTEPDHWIFDGTATAPVSNNQGFGTESLNGSWDGRAIHGSYFSHGRDRLTGSGASGWEFDQAVDARGFTTVASSQNQHARADIVVCEPQGSRGGAVSIPSITAVGSLLIDPVISQVASNAVQRARESNTHDS